MAEAIAINSLAAVLGCDEEKAREIAAKLAEHHDVQLMYWPEVRSPKSIAFTSVTATGPIDIKATDVDLGVRLVVESPLTGVAMILNFQYGQTGMLGSWLVTRAVKAQARQAKRDGKAA